MKDAEVLSEGPSVKMNCVASTLTALTSVNLICGSQPGCYLNVNVGEK